VEGATGIPFEYRRLALPAGALRMPWSSVLELRTLPPLNPENDVAVYIVVEDYGDLGQAFRETDIAEADFDTMVRDIISGEHRNPVRLVAFNTVEGWSRDVSVDIANEVLDRTYDPDATLGVGAKRARWVFGHEGSTSRPVPPS
jgi:hypothetical protein